MTAYRDLDDPTGALIVLRDDLADLIHRGPNDRADYDPERRVERIAEDAAGLAGGEYRPRYNGHPNRETWNAALWIGNEEPMYREANRIVREAFADYEEPSLLAAIRSTEPADERAAGRRRGAIHNAADELADWYAETIDAPTDGPLGDIMTYALACVDWHDIVGDIADAMELPDPGTEDEDEDA
jgi:hypothetical protein